MKHICRLLIILHITHQSTTQAPGPVVLISYPSSGVVKEGEEFELQCRYSGKATFANWFKNNIYLHETHNVFYESLADSSSGGTYRCDLWYNNWERSEPLEVFTIASDMIITLEVNPRTALSGERIILKCLVPDQKETGYILWYRKEELIHGTSQSQYIINEAEITDEASYRCERKIGYRKWVSPEVNVTVTDGDVAFQVDPPSVMEGDVLNLNCRYRKYYLWKDVGFYKGNRRIHSMKLNNWNAMHSIRVNSSKDSGSYHCTIEDKISRSVHVHVHELFAKPKLRTEPAVEIFEGDQLKFICFIETMHSNIGLEYSFYKNGKTLNLNSYNNYNCTEAASLNDSGTYLCEANVFHRGVKKKSDEVSIAIKEVFSEPTLMAEYEAQFFEGQQLKLACLVEIFRSNSSLRFVFYKDGQPLNSAAEYNYYIKETSRPDDSGIYHCEATTLSSEVTKRSNQVSVSVRRIPVSKPELAISPGQELIEGDTASLTCSVFNGSTPITYIFYRDPNKELYREESNLTTIIYQIAEINQSTQGDYRCGVLNEATGRPRHSDLVTVSVIAQSQTTVITASVLPLFLIAALIALVFFKLRKKKQDNSSGVSQPQGVTTGNRSLPPSEESSASNFEYAVVGSARNTASSSDHVTYSVVQGMKPMEDDTGTAADLVYSEVTIRKSRDCDNAGGASGGKEDNKNGPSDYCVTYAAVNRANNQATLEGGPMEEGCVYENVPRK